MILSEFSYWSASHGAEVTRLAAADDQGQERYHAFIPALEGRQGRLLREKAQGAFREALEHGLPPGEIRWR